MFQKYLSLYIIIFLALLAKPMMAVPYPSTVAKPYPGGKTYLFRLWLKDKQGTTYSLQHPEKFLSHRSLQRRMRQGIKVDSTDLPVSATYTHAVEQYGYQVVCKSKWNNTILVRSKQKEALSFLQHLPFVSNAKMVWASPDSIRRGMKRDDVRSDLMIVDDSPESYYGTTYQQLNTVNGITLHNHGFMGKGMQIAVLDAGYMNVDKIPAFSNIHINGTRNFVPDQPDNVYEYMDHGTKTLSVMALNQPKSFVGAAPDASYWLIRTEDALTESGAEEDYWTAGAEYADSVGVDVISSSLGYVCFDDKSTNYHYKDLDGKTALISRSASMLASKGIVLVNSAGNEGMGTWKKIGFPADANDILTVGAIEPDSVNAAFSSVGPTADWRIKPDVMAMGSPTAVVTGHGTVIRDTGTSFAAPIVAGMVACLWQALPDKNAKEIIDIVRRNSNNYLTPDNIMGYGIPNFWKAYVDNKQ